MNLWVFLTNTGRICNTAGILCIEVCMPGFTPFTIPEDPADHVQVHMAIKRAKAIAAELKTLIADLEDIKLVSDAVPMQVTTTARDLRFWSRVTITPVHWLWRGGMSSDRPVVTRESKNQYAYRVAWRLTHGTDPGNLRRVCDEPRCVRPDPEHHRPGRLGVGVGSTEDFTPPVDPLRGSESTSVSNIRALVCRLGHPFTQLASGRRVCRVCDRLRKRTRPDRSAETAARLDQADASRELGDVLPGGMESDDDEPDPEPGTDPQGITIEDLLNDD